MLVAALKQEAPRVVVNTTAAFYSIFELQEMYERRYNDEAPSYHCVFMAMKRNRIPSVTLVGRRMIQGKDIGIALEILKAGSRARQMNKARKELTNGCQA